MMMSRFVRLAVVCASGLAVAAPATGSAATATEPVYTHADSGHTEHLRVGTVFKVRLRGCGDCGDSWSFSKRPNAHVVKVLRRRVVPEAKPPAVGGYDHTVWTMKVVGRGSTTMRIAEHAAAEGGKVIKRFRLTIAAK
jgi:predicted secreted protein